MKLRPSTFIISMVLGMFPYSLYAIPTVTGFSFNIGSIRTFVPDNCQAWTKHARAPYLSLYVDGLFHPQCALSWEGYAGVWDDGLSSSSPTCWVDHTNYSYRDHAFGIRVGVLPLQFLNRSLPVHLTLFAGVGYHLVAAEYISGSGYGGLPGKDFGFQWGSVELGARLRFRIFGPLSIQLTSLRINPFWIQGYHLEKINRTAYMAGIRISL